MGNMMGLKFFLLTLVGLTYSSPPQNQHGHGHPPGVTEPGDDCRKFSRFHESLLKAGYSFGETCKHNKPIYECTIPTVEVLKKCVRGLHVNVQCMDHMFKKLYDEADTTTEHTTTHDTTTDNTTTNNTSNNFSPII